MAFIECVLPHPLVLVLTVRCLETAEKDYPGLPFPQNAEEIEADLAATTERGIIALVDDRQPENPRISFCTPRYELVCGLTQQKDAWFVIRLAPLGLRAHNQIVRGALRVVPDVWQVVASLPELSQAAVAPTGLDAMFSAWAQVPALAAQPARPAPSGGLNPAQVSFLANVNTLIDLACEVELEQAARQERFPVKGVELLSATTARFGLANPATGFRVGEYLRAGHGEISVGADGVVVQASGGSIVLRFFQPLDAETIQKTTWLTPKISTKQYAIQHAAVRALHNGESLNPYLLDAIVDGRFSAYPVPKISGEGERPNLAQKTLIERALVIPDLLLALGPPGTGKTDTIREVVAREAAQGKKVLVTSKNNKAVDNVLDGLASVHALRIGREEVVDPEVRPLLIDQKAASMQKRVLTDSQTGWDNLARVLERWPRIQQALERLAERMDDWQQAEAALEQKRTELSNWQTAAYMRVEQALARQEQRSQPLVLLMGQSARRADALRRQLERLRPLSELPLLGGIVTVWAGTLAEEWRKADTEHRQAAKKIQQSGENALRIWESYRQFVTASEMALGFKRSVLENEEALSVIQAELSGALDGLDYMTNTLPDTPARPQEITSQSIQALFAAWKGWYERLSKRRDLLGEWREAVQTRPQAFYPTLIRSADVIGATCIGIATDARFEDLEFDLVIADEAGQIQVMDLLVPLVRAKRAVLVGDHLQLPPLVEPEIVEKIRENEPENQELGEWLEKSLFERLIENSGTPASHRVMLNTQYRMPRPIADFISTQFYGGKYQTGRDVEHNDPFFDSPLVFIDTMKEVRHYEQRAADGQGYFNPTETRLICEMVLAYQQKGIEAGVIVPYKKQADVIRRELRRLANLGEDALSTRVATVDSFQGREQDVIIFGFTRSNTEGRIGFLAELRRLNVSLTRARRQLILVGDSTTLSSTPDLAFASLFKNLMESVRRSKGYLFAGELPNLLS